MTFLNLLNVLSIAAAVAGRMVVHERRLVAPAGFSSQGPAPATEMITISGALTSNNIAGLEQKLASISAPGSSEFRHWLTMDEVEKFVQPSLETVFAFHAFATANGLKPTIISPNGDWVSIILPVHQANTLFNAQSQRLAHPALPQVIARTLSVSLPSELVGHIDVLHPTTSFPSPQPRLAAAASNLKKGSPDASCDTSLATGLITPVRLQELYAIPATPATEETNALLVTAYVGEFAQTADLAEFLKLFRPDIPSNEMFKLLTLDNGTNQQGPGEANLDVQYAAASRRRFRYNFYQSGGLLTFRGHVNIRRRRQHTLSNDHIVRLKKVCNGYMALILRGVSALFLSGDGGVRRNHDDDLSVCQNNTFDPVFPASCPFVTSVGSTIGFGPEAAANFTGGGFSNFFASPSYQTAAVTSLLETVPSDFAGTFNRAGRGYPDVSLQGQNFAIVIIAFINDRLIAAGKPVVGFLNSFIYSNASSAFTDITSGHNSGFSSPASSLGLDGQIPQATCRGDDLLVVVRIAKIKFAGPYSWMSAKNARYGVMDPDLLLKGEKGLLIIDASVLPFVLSAHTQAASYVIAERGADLVKASWAT
ncbi:family S53 protease-like protein [Mycena vulgaris]|nr:family S53 protease-like protein [Mycena vulgaris]